MGKRGKGYGSEDHFVRYCSEQNRASTLDGLLLQTLGSRPGTSVEWIYPSDGRNREPRGLDFLREHANVGRSWQEFWPQRGNQPNWDGIARIHGNGLDPDWVLMEAKSNQPEFCSSPCQASFQGGRRQIERSLKRVKRYLGVHRHFPWLGTYYQHANRLAVLYFLTVEANISARFLEVFMTGDEFPDRRHCPENRAEWDGLLEARRLTLGLPSHHPLSPRLFTLFLPALR